MHFFFSPLSRSLSHLAWYKRFLSSRCECLSAHQYRRPRAIITPGEEKIRKIHSWETHTNEHTGSFVWTAVAWNIFTVRPRLIALLCPSIPPTTQCYAPKRRLFSFFFLLTYTWSIQDLALSVVHPLQSDLHPNDSLCAIPISPLHGSPFTLTRASSPGPFLL